MNLSILKCQSMKEIQEKLSGVLEKCHLPDSKKAQILLKPNLNSDMNALTGNTTDLRILSGVVRFLKSNGYTNIVIGEGTNSGFYRNNIGVITRLKIDSLAEHFGIRVLDLNYSRSEKIRFENGIEVGVAREPLEADFFINMPKLKTHFEVGISVCLKNLMGCLVGQENKKKMHQDLAKNILNLGKRVKPHLQIVDAVIAMEGTGPSRGRPVNLGLILVGDDPFLTDLACAKLMGFDYGQVPYLKLAEEEGFIGSDYYSYLNSLELEKFQRDFKKPKVNPLVNFIHLKHQRFFLSLRALLPFRYLASTKMGGKLLFLSGLRQDDFVGEEDEINRVYHDAEKCIRCRKCAVYCPLGLNLPEDAGKGDCIRCLYCFLVCPQGAIRAEGRLGFLEKQLRQYDNLVRRVA